MLNSECSGCAQARNDLAYADREIATSRADAQDQREKVRLLELQKKDLEAEVQRLLTQIKESFQGGLEMNQLASRSLSERDQYRADLQASELQKSELLKAADALLGNMGGPNTPVCPEYEDEFVALELLVDSLQGNSVEDIEKRVELQGAVPTTAEAEEIHKKIGDGPLILGAVEVEALKDSQFKGPSAPYTEKRVCGFWTGGRPCQESVPCKVHGEYPEQKY